MNLKFKVTEWKEVGSAVLAFAKTAAPDDQLYTKAPNTLVLGFINQRKDALIKSERTTLTFSVIAVHDLGPALRVDTVPADRHADYHPKDSNTQEFYVLLNSQLKPGDTVSVDLMF